MENFVAVAALDELASGRGKAVLVEGREVAIFKIDEQYYAIENECPHQGAPLCEGFLDGETVTCPWHGWQFDLQTGRGLTVAGIDVEAFPVRIEDGHVKIACGR